MPDGASFPDLPLVLAGLPRGVLDLLRTAGVPAIGLPAGAPSISNSGKFVLFDSRSPRSSQAVRPAVRAGLIALDVAHCGLPEDSETPLHGLPSIEFMRNLKELVEAHQGIWLRVADFPFPYESALCLSVDHRAEELSELATFKELLSGAVTHFVPTRLRGDWLTYVALGGAGEVGWLIDHEAIEETPRKTRAHWATRKARFVAQEVAVRGLRIVHRDLEVPGTAAMVNLGLAYSCLPAPGAAGGTIRSCGQWIQYGTLTLDQLAASRDFGPPQFASDPSKTQSQYDPADIHSPEPAASDGSSLTVLLRSEGGLDALPPVLAAMMQHYRAGRPVFVHDRAVMPGVAQDFLLLRKAAELLPLMWRTTFGGFAQWWAHRHRLELRVWQADQGMEIHTVGDLAAIPASIEVWRGQHRAVLPLNQSRLAVRDDQVAFVHMPDRSPAGFVPGPDRPGRRKSGKLLPHDSWAA